MADKDSAKRPTRASARNKDLATNGVTTEKSPKGSPSKSPRGRGKAGKTPPVKEVFEVPAVGRGRGKSKAVEKQIPVEEALLCGKCNRTFENVAKFKRHVRFCTDSLTDNDRDYEFAEDDEELASVAVGSIGDKLKRIMAPEPQPGTSRSSANHAPMHYKNSKRGSLPFPKSPKPAVQARRSKRNVEGEGDDDIDDPDVNLRDKMKGVMLTKVNELIDETTAAAAAGKCHCCGEDIDTAHTGGDFKCEDCSKMFKLKSSLERHRRVIHMEGETYSCPECDARCPDKGTLARHMYTHTGLKPYSCARCDKQFSRKYHLERHIVQTGCDGKPKPTHPCQVCGRMFSRKDNLREHLRAHAGQVKRKKKYQCEYCHKDFHGTSLLQIHVRTHTGERPYTCDFCEKGFPSSGAMKKHRRMHTGERPYECKECFAKFSAKETLNRHIKTHTGVKPHICQYCGKSFIQASQLRSHIFHHTGENGYTCVHCNKAFNRRVRLHMHVKYVHEGAKPFECDMCTKTFVRKEDLARHTILHSGVKSHKCPICEKTFAMKSSLKIHLLTHTKEPPRSCDECGRAFIRQDCLLRHMRSKHRDMLEEILAEAEKKKLQQQLLTATAAASSTGSQPGTSSEGISLSAALSGPTPMSLGLGPASLPGTAMSESVLADSIRELLTLLVDETTLRTFGWPDEPVDRLLESVIKRCGHQPVSAEDYGYTDRLRENAKLLFTVVIDDSAVKTLLNNQTVDEVILHVLRLAKS